MSATHHDDVHVNLLQAGYVLVYVTLKSKDTNARHRQLPTALGETNVER
jgi:hypothetical protein